MSEIIEFNKEPARLKQIIESAGTTIGSVHFIKRSDGSLRKMCYRLHVRKPSVAPVPHGLAAGDKVAAVPSGANVPSMSAADLQALNQAPPMVYDGPDVDPLPPTYKDRKIFDAEHNQITVLDANKVVRDSAGKKIGRGAWRTIPLDTIVQVTVKGKTYKVQQ
jgi:hypothetical protein